MYGFVEKTRFCKHFRQDKEENQSETAKIFRCADIVIN